MFPLVLVSNRPPACEIGLNGLPMRGSVTQEAAENMGCVFDIRFLGADLNLLPTIHRTECVTVMGNIKRRAAIGMDFCRATAEQRLEGQK